MLFLDKNVESSEVEFEFLVNLALKEKVSWPKLKSFLDDMTSTYEKSKKLNDVLLNSLEQLHSKTIQTQTQEKTDEPETEEQEITENGSENHVRGEYL